MLLSFTQHLNPLLYALDSTDNEDSLSEILFEFIVRKIDIYNKLSTISKGPGPDEIPTWVLKYYSLFHSLPIASIFNVSVQLASIPPIWKKADVISIHKRFIIFLVEVMAQRMQLGSFF